MNLTILGNNSAIPAHGRYPTAQIIEHQQDLYLIDCGEGTQLRIHEYKFKPNRIKAIFISHLHGDHYFGLIGLLSSLSLKNRAQPIDLYAPSLLQNILQLQLDAAHTQLSFPLHFIELEPDTTHEFEINPYLKVTAFPVQHRIPTHGFKFTVAPGLRKLNIAACQRYEIPVRSYKSLQLGKDYPLPDGSTLPNELFTFEGTPSKQYVYAADTRVFPELPKLIGPCDLLYHESTYLHEDTLKANQRYHSTAKQAATIALEAGAQQLMLGHFSSRYKDLHPFLLEAQSIFSNTLLSEAGQTYSI